jgi:hypothetical protein
MGQHKRKVKYWKKIPLYVSEKGDLYTTDEKKTFSVKLRKCKKKIEVV